jgi:polar amino acid transport system permease protein
MSAASEAERRKPGLIPWTGKQLANMPWWALIILLMGVLITYFIWTSPTYQDAFLFLVVGIRFTILVSLISFGVALVMGLILGLGRVSKNVAFYTLSSVYVEVVRGIPILVLLIYFAYVVTPVTVGMLNGLGAMLQSREDRWRLLVPWAWVISRACATSSFLRPSGQSCPPWATTSYPWSRTPP